MNFDTYINIYEELINTTDILNVKYFTNKYSLSKIELKTILIKIKDNEYINKNNSILKTLLDELKDIETDFTIFSNGYNEKKDFHQEEKETKKNTKKSIKPNLSKILFTLSKNINIYISKIKHINLEKKQYIQIGIGALSVFFIMLITTIFMLNDNTETKNQNSKIDANNVIISKKSINELPTKKIEKKQVEIEDNKIDVTLPIKNLEKQELIKKEQTVENKLDNIKIIENKKENRVRAIITLDNTQKEIKKKIVNDTKPKYKIRDEFKNIKDQLTYENHMIKYKNKYYRENDTLEGFKIFKITPVYVKFEDTKTNIRKRVLLN
ncbi:hypothetical protein [Arcobacter sp. CECT 8985]|uniref:hypothetical protein n=1 Tax=Arcobacter sp. CECT 8985 TaxID=1935424 RepID=UPI00100C232E|nr:hypothetical protein [Arcobacter sp. CECT 8985]RXJ86424.1 hypothetical protein CRU93_08385 [Arcobacter sp. CECT 8985]